VVRRTSRPGTGRAAASVVRGRKSVAVENHLLVLKPRSGRHKDCLSVMDYLNSPVVDSILNATLRCRHLTVGAIRAIPWPDH
jgi:hypothetical protein